MDVQTYFLLLIAIVLAVLGAWFLPARVLAYLVRSHLLVVVQPDTELQIPGKLFEYLYLGRPILALTGRGATADTVTRYHLGDVVGPRDANQIVDVIRHRYREFPSGSWTERVNKNETLPVKI